MLRIVMALFLVLHGLVHLLYAGQSLRLFELQAGMVWPDGSLAFSRIMGDEKVRELTAILLLLTAVGFVAAGVSVFASQPWWRALVVVVSVFSSLLYLLLWDGGMQHLDDKGAVGMLINVAIVAAVGVVHWPALGL